MLKNPLQKQKQNRRFPHSSLRPQRRLVGFPYLVRLSVMSWYSKSARPRGIPSQAMMRMMMTAFSQWWPARSRTRHSSFSFSPLRRITWRDGGARHGECWPPSKHCWFQKATAELFRLQQLSFKRLCSSFDMKCSITHSITSMSSFELFLL